MKKCDQCGKPFKGKSYPIVDEQFEKQKGLAQCTECYATQILGIEWEKHKD